MYIDCSYIYIYIYIYAPVDCQNFPTHPHYYGPGMTYFSGEVQINSLTGLSEYVIQGAL